MEKNKDVIRRSKKDNFRRSNGDPILQQLLISVHEYILYPDECYHQSSKILYNTVIWLLLPRCASTASLTTRLHLFFRIFMTSLLSLLCYKQDKKFLHPLDLFSPNNKLLFGHRSPSKSHYCSMFYIIIIKTLEMRIMNYYNVQFYWNLMPHEVNYCT